MTTANSQLPPALAALQGRLAGHLVLPSDQGYEEARNVWNATVDRRPMVIARCATVDDARLTLEASQAAGVPLVVRGGGHSIAGFSSCDDGVVLDLSLMNGVHVDPATRSATANGGAKWGSLDRATQPHGLATTGGMISTTGIVGLTLGGGLGYLMRKHGLSCDNVAHFELLNAHGDVQRVTPETDPELAWALQGGGGNFGIVTEIGFRLHPVGPAVPAGVLSYPMAQARELLHHFATVCETSSTDLCSYFMISAGDEENEPSASILLLWLGDPQQADAAFAPYRAFGPAMRDSLDMVQYADLQCAFDSSSPPGRRNYWKSHLVDVIDDAFVNTLIDGVLRKPVPKGAGPRGGVIIEQLGGAVAARAENDTAFGSRTARFSLELISVWADRDEDNVHRDWTRGLWETLRPHGRKQVYVNFMDSDDAVRIEEAYDGQRLARLQGLKARHDPNNVFWANHNITPAVP